MEIEKRKVEISEEEKAIYRLKVHTEGAGLRNGTVVVNKADVETVLNMLEKKDKEAQQYFETTIIQSQKFDEEVEKRDKIIEKIAFSLADYQMYYDYDKCRSPHMIKQKADEIIKYFEEKFKNEN